MNNINQEIKDLEATLVSLKAKSKLQETTLTPVSFESKGELAKALVDGRTFKTLCGAILMYTDSCGCFSPFRYMKDGDEGSMAIVWRQYDNLQEINAAPAEPWYLNIPEEGVECYVSDYDPDPYPSTTKVLVTGYDQSLSFPFKCLGNWWKYARPAN
jgi:hypothetical protein